MIHPFFFQCTCLCFTFREPTLAEIEENLIELFPMLKDDKENRSPRVNQIVDIMQSSKRSLLHVYRLDSDKNISETIFQAIFSGIF